MGTTRYDVPTGCAWQGGECRPTGYNPSTLACDSGCLTSSFACGVVNGQCRLVPHNVTCCTSLPTPTPPPPPVLTLEFQCGLWGTGGWCRQGGQLKSTGADPSGGTVTVSGALGDPANTAVACQGSKTCTVQVSLPEGQGMAQVKATSRYGQAQGSQAWHYDPTYPTLQVGLMPASPDGANGWYVTTPTLTLQGSDATSGVAALRVSPDGGTTWHTAPWQVPDGQYTLLAQAVDGAGNITQKQVVVKVDTTPPQVRYQIPAADGQNGWHITPVQVQVGGQDAVSGVASAEVSVDGGAWQTGSTVLAADGVHHLTFRAVDAAGNTAQAGPETVRVDLHPPQVVWGSGWDGALGCTPVLGGQVTDGAGSGVAGAALSWDGGQTWEALQPDAQGHWQVQPDLRRWADGGYQALLQVWDQAGNQDVSKHTFTVSQPAPHIVVAPLHQDARWSFWQTLHFGVRSTCLPIARIRIVVEGPHANRTVTWDTGHWPAPAADGSAPATYTVTWRWDTRWNDGAYAHPGEYPARFEVWDAWGRKWMEYGTLVVPVMSGPSPTPEALPSPTATPTAAPATPTATALAAGFVPPTPWPTATPGFTPTPLLPPATATPQPAAAPVARHTSRKGSAPPWAKTVAVGTLFAGLLAALVAAYYRRKLAAWRARLSAYLATKRQAEAQAQVEVEATASPPEPYTPPPGSPEAALLEGDMIVPGKTPQVVHELPPQHAAPPPLDLARWKEEDYNRMKAMKRHPSHPVFKIVTGVLMIGAGAITATLGGLVWAGVGVEHTAGAATGIGEIIALADTPELLGLGGLLIGAGIGFIGGGVKLISSGLHGLWESEK